jgi:hypothetical protein
MGRQSIASASYLQADNVKPHYRYSWHEGCPVYVGRFPSRRHLLGFLKHQVVRVKLGMPIETTPWDRE